MARVLTAWRPFLSDLWATIDLYEKQSKNGHDLAWASGAHAALIHGFLERPQFVASKAVSVPSVCSPSVVRNPW